MIDIAKDFNALNGFLTCFSSAYNVIVLYHVKPNREVISEEESKKFPISILDKEVVIEYVKVTKDQIIDTLREAKKYCIYQYFQAKIFHLSLIVNLMIQNNGLFQ